MKQYEMDVENCRGACLEGGSLVILKAAIMQRLLDEAPLVSLVTPEQYAEGVSSKQIEKFVQLDKHIRRGFELIVEKLQHSAKNSS